MIAIFNLIVEKSFYFVQLSSLENLFRLLFYDIFKISVHLAFFSVLTKIIDVERNIKGNNLLHEMFNQIPDEKD